MTPQAAAQRFVRLVLRASFDDVLDLTDRVGLDNDAPVRARKAAYAKIETAVRRQFRATHDLDALERAVPLAVPKKHRADVAIALSNLLMAVADEFTGDAARKLDQAAARKVDHSRGVHSTRIGRQRRPTLGALLCAVSLLQEGPVGGVEHPLCGVPRRP